MKRPTITSYAVLGLLAIRPWTAYELAQQVDRSLALLWPSSMRTIYNEPRRLEQMGWVTSQERSDGRRQATVYSITATGRTALEEWLASTPDEPPVAFEGLLRVMYADQGSIDDLIQAVQGSAEQWRMRILQGLPQLQGYLDDGGPFPQRLHLIALIVSFLDRYATLVEDFAAEVAAEARTWPSTHDVGLTPHAKAVISDVVERRRAR